MDTGVATTKDGAPVDPAVSADVAATCLMASAINASLSCVLSKHAPIIKSLKSQPQMPGSASPVPAQLMKFGCHFPVWGQLHILFHVLAEPVSESLQVC